jgi:predicted transcriptional regulator
LFDAEYKFMQLVWAHEPVNSTDLARLSLEQLGWKKSTTYTVLRKLCARGILRNQDATVTARIKQEAIHREESSRLIEKSFGGSLPQFLAAFLGERKLSARESAELRRIIDEAAKR